MATNVSPTIQDIQRKQEYLGGLSKNLQDSYAGLPAYESGLRANVMGGSPELDSLRGSYGGAVSELFKYDQEAATRYGDPSSNVYVEDPYARAKAVSGGVGQRADLASTTYQAYAKQKDILGSIIDKALKIKEAELTGNKLAIDAAQKDLDIDLDLYKYNTDRTDQGFGVATTVSTPEDIALAAESVKNGLKKVADFPKSAQPAIEAEVNKKTAEEANAIKEEALDIVRQLKASKLGPVTGLLQVRGLIPGTQAQETINKINQLKGKLSLDQRKLLKGTGTISDIEQKMLENSVSALGRNLSESSFKAELEKIEKALSGTGTKTGTSLSDDEIKKALGN